MPQRPKPQKSRPQKNAATVSPSEIPPEVEIVRVEELPTYYSNQALISLHPFDFRIEFRQSRAVDDKVIAKPLVQVYISPQHGKALLDLLARQVARYEEAFGILPEPEETGEKMIEAVQKVQQESSDREE